MQNSNSPYIHYHNLTDYLGNVRSVIRAEGSGVAVVQKQDCYAFGKTKSILTGGISRYLYNGKEVQAEIRDQLDYSFSCPFLMVFMSSRWSVTGQGSMMQRLGGGTW